jgi:uncharacterized membrane protein YhaH (DUF805 family)
MNYYFKVLRTFSFNGRARRAEFWWFVLFNLMAQFALRFISMPLGLVINVDAGGAFVLDNNLTNDSTALLELIYSLLVLIQSIALNVRRFHDRGLSGWWIVIASLVIIVAAVVSGVMPQLAPVGLGVMIVAGLACFVISVLPGTEGPNKYGADPKGHPGDVAETFA